MNYIKSKSWLCLGLSCALLSMATAGQAAAADDDTVRKTTTFEGLVSGGGASADTERTMQEYGALKLSGERGKPGRATDKQKLTGNEAGSPDTDFWLYSADVVLFLDADRDGYYAGIDLIFDADTYYEVADVYAVLYLSYEYGPWNEYAETETFTIFGASAGDEYAVETDLVQGYPTGNYDILIELYDAYDNSFVASLGPEDTSELSILPLEDAGRDAPSGTTQIVVNSGGGGAPGWLLILGLAGASLLRRSRG